MPGFPQLLPHLSVGVSQSGIVVTLALHCPELSNPDTRWIVGSLKVKWCPFSQREDEA